MTFTSFIKPESDPNIIVPTKPFNLSPNIVERFSLKDKVTVITGGAGAIGSAIAEGYAQAGGHVIILDHASSDNGLTKDYHQRMESSPSFSKSMSQILNKSNK